MNSEVVEKKHKVIFYFGLAVFALNRLWAYQQYSVTAALIPAPIEVGMPFIKYERSSIFDCTPEFYSFKLTGNTLTRIRSEKLKFFENATSSIDERSGSQTITFEPWKNTPGDFDFPAIRSHGGDCVEGRLTGEWEEKIGKALNKPGSYYTTAPADAKEGEFTKSIVVLPDLKLVIISDLIWD